MADDQEEVVYRFTGDVSSLRQATESALGLLDKYQAQIDRISADGGFGKNVKVSKSFQSQLNAATKQMTDMQKQMQGLSDVQLFPSSQITQQLQSSISTIDQIFGKLDSSTALSTKEVQALAAQLRVANTGLKAHSADITAIIQKEQAWQSTLATIGARTSQLRDAMSNAFTPILNLLGRLSAPFDAVAPKMQAFRDRALAAFGKVSQVANTVVSAFRRVKQAEEDTADSAEESADAHEELQRALEKTQSATGPLAKGLQAVQSVCSVLKRVVTALISKPMAEWMSKAAKQSITYAENVNLFTVAMGDALDVGTEFINQMSEVYGMDPSNLMRYAGNFYQLADAIDMPDEAASKLSLSLVKATNDISSLFNVPIEKVFDDLSSGMQGMSRAVRKYGMDTRTTTLQQTALSLGITDSVESMSEANRQGLRFITMMKQASNASGDFAATIESPANQLKIFKEQMSQLGRAIGDLFIQPLAEALQYLNGFVMALRMVISFIGSILGLVSNVTGRTNESTESAEESIKNIGAAAGGATKKLKGMLAPFDELNILSKQDDSSGGGFDFNAPEVLDPAIADAIANMELGLENIRMKALDVRDAILEFLGFKLDGDSILSWDAATLEANLIGMLPEWFSTIQVALSTFWASTQSIRDGLSALWTESIQPMLTEIGNAIAPVIGTIIALFEDRVNMIADIFDSLKSMWTNTLLPVLTALFDAIRNLAKIFGTLWTEYVDPILQHISDGMNTLWQTTLRPIIENIVAIVGGVIEIILALWNNVLVPKVNWLLEVLAPIVVNVFNAVWDTILTVVSNIGQSINGLLQILRGVIDFLAGVFTGDWSRVWQGLVGIFTGIWNTIAGVVKSVFNVVIGIINTVLGAISGAINSIIRAINKISFKAPDWIPGVGGKTLGFNIPEVSAWSIPYLASGAVVKSPTLAMVGEGKYDEAVIPLGNSPQMKDLVNQIADATKSRGSSEPIQVNVYIGNEQVAEYTYKATKRAELQTNGGI